MAASSLPRWRRRRDSVQNLCLIPQAFMIPLAVWREAQLKGTVTWNEPFDQISWDPLLFFR
jgi:hypothetical protein